MHPSPNGSLRNGIARLFARRRRSPSAPPGVRSPQAGPLFRPSTRTHHQSPRASRAFTLIELMIVLALIATLLTLSLPRYFGSLERSKEAALKQTLAATRDAIDKFFSDTGKYPESLPELVEKRYLRNVPLDPITDSTTTWTIVAAPDPLAKGEVYDLKSGAPGASSDGKSYAEY